MIKGNKILIVLQNLYIRCRSEQNKKKLLFAINQELIKEKIKTSKNVYS